jgi:pyruvate dehydrogenase E2 component (dihydrolipoamide acetyltransferase)
MLPPEITVPPKINTAMDTAEKAKIQAALEKRRTQALQQVVPPENSENAAAPSTNTPKVVKLSERRQAIGSQLQRSIQTVPHSLLEVQVDASGIEVLQQAILKPSITSILIRACAWALQRNLWLNATFNPDKSGEIALWPSANIGMIVATEDGPVIPVIHQAERLSLREIHEKVSSLSEHARKNLLSADNLADATFTISDMGALGVDRCSAIIHPPQVAILTAGRIIKQFVSEAKDRDSRPALHPTINLTLLVDQRAVDSVQAAHFLTDLRSVLEDPSRLV